MTPLEIRPYRSSDRTAVAEVCVRTAAAGGDARGLYSDDSLMAEVYALPYVEHSPELAFMVVEQVPATVGDPLAVDDGRLLGYVVGVADTREFVTWWEREWTPGFVRRHPEPGPPTGAEPAYTEAALLRDGAHPQRMLRSLSDGQLADFPAHLHIDLVPEAQGRGLGRRLMDTLREALVHQGAPGLHLGYDPANSSARAFYDRLGFHELPTPQPDARLLAITTG
jgi:ribosomal protein S18 acetylase RimI-like enzyme